MQKFDIQDRHRQRQTGQNKKMDFNKKYFKSFKM